MAGDPPCWSHLFDDYEHESESKQMTEAKTAGSGKKERGVKREEGSSKNKTNKAGASNGQAKISADLRQFLLGNQSRIEQELFDFLRIPSVSAKSEHNGDTKRAAEWVKSSLGKMRIPAKIYPTAVHPVVAGEWRNAPGAPTVLIYGHYDVQPAEPLELWTSPAFEPTVRDGRIYARGSVDDKGQLFLHIKALEAHLAARGTLPVNVIVLAEGEEEVGSENLAFFIESHAELLKCDGVVISDSS